MQQLHQKDHALFSPLYESIKKKLQDIKASDSGPAVLKQMQKNGVELNEYYQNTLLAGLSDCLEDLKSTAELKDNLKTAMNSR